MGPILTATSITRRSTMALVSRSISDLAITGDLTCMPGRVTTDTLFITKVSCSYSRDPGLRKFFSSALFFPKLKSERCSVPASALPVRKPTRKEIDLYYKTHRSKFHAPERIHALHIVKNVESAS